jgi:hypothetical protein
MTLTDYGSGDNWLEVAGHIETANSKNVISKGYIESIGGGGYYNDAGIYYFVKQSSAAGEPTRLEYTGSVIRTYISSTLVHQTSTAGIELNNKNITGISYLDAYGTGPLEIRSHLLFNYTDPKIEFDTDDYLWYDQSANILEFAIGTTPAANLGAELARFGVSSSADATSVASGFQALSSNPTMIFGNSSSTNVEKTCELVVPRYAGTSQVGALMMRADCGSGYQRLRIGGDSNLGHYGMTEIKMYVAPNITSAGSLALNITSTSVSITPTLYLGSYLSINSAATYGSFMISTVEEMRLQSAGLKVHGLTVGDITTAGWDPADNDLKVVGGVSIGHSADPGDDICSVGDADFALDFTVANVPRLRFDTNLRIYGDRSGDQIACVVNATVQQWFASYSNLKQHLKMDSTAVVTQDGGSMGAPADSSEVNSFNRQNIIGSWGYVNTSGTLQDHYNVSSLSGSFPNFSVTHDWVVNANLAPITFGYYNTAVATDGYVIMVTTISSAGFNWYFQDVTGSSVNNCGTSFIRMAA